MVNRFESAPGPVPTPGPRIETEHNEATVERREWLNQYFDGGTSVRNEDGITLINNTSEHAEMLKQWESKLSPQAQPLVEELSDSFDSEKGIGATPAQLALMAWMQKDEEKLRELVEFGKSLREAYWQPGMSWDQLPEKNKRFIRLGEITAVNSKILLARVLGPESVEPEFVDQLLRYAKSTDVPFLGKVAAGIKQSLGYEPDEEQPEWDTLTENQKSTLFDLAPKQRNSRHDTDGTDFDVDDDEDTGWYGPRFSDN